MHWALNRNPWILSFKTGTFRSLVDTGFSSASILGHPQSAQQELSSLTALGFQARCQPGEVQVQWNVCWLSHTSSGGFQLSMGQRFLVLQEFELELCTKMHSAGDIPLPLSFSLSCYRLQASVLVL